MYVHERLKMINDAMDLASLECLLCEREEQISDLSVRGWWTGLPVTSFLEGRDHATWLA